MNMPLLRNFFIGPGVRSWSEIAVTSSTITISRMSSGLSIDR